MDALVETAVSGAAAFAELAKLYRPALLRAATRMVGETDAEDAVQEALCDAMVGMGKFDERKGCIRAWLMGFVKKECEKVWRRRERVPTVALDDALEIAGEDPMGIPGTSELAEEVRAAIAKLPKMQREAFEMYADDKSGRDIARAMGISEKAANQNVSRARKKLRRELVTFGGL